MLVPHEPWLVALSIAIAVQGAFVGLSWRAGWTARTDFGAASLWPAPL